MDLVNTQYRAQPNAWNGALYAGSVIAIWTGFVLVSRAGGVSVLTAWDVIAIRYSSAALLVLPLWWGRRRTPLWTTRHCLLAAVGGLGYAVLAFAAFKRVPAAHAGILLPGLQPFAASLAAWLLLGERPGRLRVVGLAAIAGGVACLLVDGLRATALLGDGLMLGASACWACYAVLLRRWSVSPWDATLAVTLLTAMAYLPVYALLLPKQLSLASGADIALQAVYQGLVATIIQMFLFVRTVALIGPTRLSLLMALVPGLAGVAAVPLLGEPLGSWLVAGLAWVSLGAWIGSRPVKPIPERKPCPT